MAILARDTQKEFVPAPKGLHDAVCVDVVDLGIVESQYGKKAMVKLVWQLAECQADSQRQFLVQRRYGLSLNTKASLRKDLETWRGKKFTNDELAGFDLEKLLGANAQLQIVHNVMDDGATYANVQAIVPAAKGVPKLVGRDYIRERDRLSDGPSRGHETSSDEDEVPF